MISAAILLLASGLVGAGGERLGSPVLPGYIVGYDAADPGRDAAIREEVLQGETVDAWSRMVTTQRFGGLATRISPLDFARLVAGRMVAGCPGATATPPRAVSGLPAARVEVNCPRNPATGQSEVMLMLVIAGNGALHVKQVAFRGGSDARALTWAGRLLDQVRLCRAGDNRGVCAN